jgi:bifunctional non-homologous end joining protein LigD
VRLLTRTGKDWTERFPAVAAAAAELPVEAALLDGEVVALAADGSSSFAALQQALGRHAGGPLVCYLFDLLHLDGIDLTACPLEQRKSLLARLLARAGRDETTTLRFSDHVVGRGAEFHRQACRHGLEGVVSKRREAPYHPGRHRDWLKIRCSQRQELVIGGFTEPSGSRAGLGSLILGVYPVPGAAAQGGKLAHAGRVGTGFDRRTLTALRGRLEALETDEAPFADPRAAAAGGSRRGVHWVRPELVCEVAFTEWTADGVLRHPSFQGLREDEPAEEVVREMPVARAKKPEGPARGRQGAARRGGRRGSTVEVAGVRITHPERVLYPEPGVTKRDLAAYYAGVADRMLPHLAGRPLSLVRCPQGQPGDCFFQKHIDGSFPAAVRRIAVTEKGGARKTYAVADDRDALLSLVQMGVLELHTWGARADRLDRPDVLVFDLDPDEGLDWKHVVTGARAVRGLLAELGLTSFAKTTGGKGLHVVVPIERRTGWDEVREFTRGVAEAIVRAAPERFVATMSKAQRQGKVFIDYLRNARGATFIAPYSSRARPGATVAAPVSWDEIGRLRPGGYTVTNLARRLARREADPWADWGSTRQSLTRAMRRAVGG